MLLRPAADGSLWLERGTDEAVPRSDFFGLMRSGRLKVPDGVEICDTGEGRR